MNRASETYGTITLDLTFVSLELQKEKSIEIKRIQEMAENFLNWAKGINIQNQEDEQNPNRING